MLKKADNPFIGDSPPKTITDEQFQHYEMEARFRRSKASFPPTEILEAGDITGWLQLHVENLLDKSQRNRMHGGFSQLLGLSTGVVAFLSTGTAIAPLAPVAITLGLLGYGASVADSAFRLGRILPIPFSSFTLQKLAQSASADGREALRATYDDEQPERFDTMAFLPFKERRELEMLVDYQGLMLELLSNVPEGKRFAIYYVLRQAYIDGGFGSQNVVAQINKLVETVSPDSSLDQNLIRNIKGRLGLLPTEETAESERDIFGFGITMLASQNTAENFPHDTAENGIGTPENLPRERENNSPDSAFSIPSSSASNSHPEAAVNRAALLQLSLEQRAEYVIALLKKHHFDLARCVERQISVICGNQRGGKGTLMAVLAILSKALSPDLKVHYFTAGKDTYPFKCDRLVSAHSYPQEEEPDKAVALSLYGYLREMDKASVGAYADRIIVIDEAVALSDYLDAEQKQWIIRFLLSRASKKGAQIFVVLHGHNLTSWVGTGNTSGLSSTFKADVTFIGCEATSKKVGALRSIAVATGKYFLADPESFATPIKGGDIGTIPNWLKTQTNPFTGQPDPARSLLMFFPELQDNSCASPATKQLTEEQKTDSLSVEERQELHNAITKVEFDAPTEPQLSPQSQELCRYIRERGGVMEALTIAKNKGLPIARVRELLREIITGEQGEPWGHDGIRLF